MTRRTPAGPPLIFLLLLICAVPSPASAFRLVKLWASEPVFQVPESICWDFDREIIYVSNIAGNPAAKDGEGFISRVSIDGEVKKLKWITGLNAPKGMAVHGGKLYVSDIDELVVIDIRTDKVEERHNAEGAVFLNDVAADKDGNIYVSDSSRENSAIYKFSGGSMRAWLRHRDIQSPNGLLVDGGRLIVGNSGDATLKAVDLRSKDVTTLVSVGSPIDGLKMDERGDFIVSDWKGKTMLIEPDGGIYILLDTTSEKINSADIEYVPEYDMVLIPTFSDNRVVAARLVD